MAKSRRASVGRPLGATLLSEIVSRHVELGALDKKAEELSIERGLTRGNLLICLRRYRTQQRVSLRRLAVKLGCSHGMLHDIEQARRWSDEIVLAYVEWAIHGNRLANHLRQDALLMTGQERFE